MHQLKSIANLMLCEMQNKQIFRCLFFPFVDVCRTLIISAICYQIPLFVFFSFDKN